MRDDLIQLGFTVHEADVYLSLLEIGQTGAGEIIKRTQLHRNIVYDTLEKLISKKLVVKVFKKNIALFQITDPKRIVEHEKTRLNIAEDLVPELLSRAEVKQDIVVYDGLEGFRTYSLNMLDSIEPDGNLYVIGSVGDRWFELMGDKLQQYQRKRLKRKIWWKITAYSEAENEKKLVDEPDKLVEVRILPQPFNPEASMLVYGDRVALQTLVEPYGVIEIKNAVLAQSYMNYFNTLWERGESVK